MQVSGQVGLDASGAPIADPEQQFIAVFENIGHVLALAGATFADIVDMTSFHTTFDHYDTFATVKDRYISGSVPPAWTAVGVTALVTPGLLVEIKCTALLSG